MRDRIYLSSPHMCGEEINYIEEAFKTNWIAPLGPNVDSFEREVAELVNIRGAVALNSGTSAIHLALKALGINRGDIVFCSALTFSASCNPIIYEGAVPVFIDCDPGSWNMSTEALKKALKYYESIDKLPKAVIVVNLYGQSADYDKLLGVCNDLNIPILEDAAESLGATYKGIYSGTLGKFGAYSFNGNKIITTSGGGMLVSNDLEAVKKVRFWSTQSRENERHYEHRELGYNYRMSNVLAGIGRGQLTILKERIKKKKEIYEFYKQSFKDIDAIEMMPIESYGEPNYWLSVITIKKESEICPLDIILALEKENIESRPVWKPMHLQPFYLNYQFFSHYDNKNSVSEDIFNRGVCLPSDTKLNKENLNRVVTIIRKLFGEV